MPSARALFLRDNAERTVGRPLRKRRMVLGGLASVTGVGTEQLSEVHLFAVRIVRTSSTTIEPLGARTILGAESKKSENSRNL